MKKFLFIITFFYLIQIQAQAYQNGEFLKYRIHYGWINAGEATLKLEEKYMSGKKMYHAVGKGRTTSLAAWVIKVNDLYETYFDEHNRPFRFIRNIHEGNYKKNVEFIFNHDNHTLQVIDKLTNKVRQFKVQPGIQDMLSVYYKLRNIDTDTLKTGDYITETLFFDYDTFRFKMKILGRQVIKTKFGYIKTLVLRPYVEAERVFKEEESLTVWVTDDKNKIPVRIQAKLLVGSIKADLVEFRNIKYPLYFSKSRHF